MKAGPGHKKIEEAPRFIPHHFSPSGVSRCQNIPQNFSDDKKLEAFLEKKVSKREAQMLNRYRKMYRKIDKAKEEYAQWTESKRLKAQGQNVKVKQPRKEIQRLNLEPGFTELLRDPALITQK
jgi:hypothetical protein